MKNFVCVLLAIALVLIAAPAFAQCNSANGQCGAPNGLSAAAINGLAFQQQQSAATSASSAAAAPAFAQPAAPAFAYQMYAYPGVSAQAAVVHPSQLMFALPPVMPTQPAGVAVAPPTIPVQPSYYSLIGLQGAPVAASAGGASSAASAAAAAPVAVAPIPVNPGLAQASASGSCASGNCSARSGGLLRRVFGQRSSSRSVSISRSRVR